MSYHLLEAGKQLSPFNITLTYLLQSFKIRRKSLDVYKELFSQITQKALFQYMHSYFVAFHTFPLRTHKHTHTYTHIYIYAWIWYYVYIVRNVFNCNITDKLKQRWNKGTYLIVPRTCEHLCYWGRKHISSKIISDKINLSKSEFRRHLVMS